MVNISLISIINACKVATLACIVGFAYHFGFQTLRAWIYVALHCTYLAWWFLHQRLSPTWGNTVFGPGDFSIPFILTTFLTVGPGYALPGYYAFKSTDEPQPWLVTASIMLFAWGSLINCAADFYKDGAKSAKPGASVTGGPFRLARHINWFGAWMRYSSFALISGTPPAPLAFFPLAWTMLLNLASLQERDARKAKRVADKGDVYLTTTPAVVPWRLLF